MIQLEPKSTKFALDGTSLSSVTDSGTSKTVQRTKRPKPSDFITKTTGIVVKETKEKSDSKLDSLAMQQDNLRCGDKSSMQHASVRHVDELTASSLETIRPLPAVFHTKLAVIPSGTTSGKSELVRASEAILKAVDVRPVQESPSERAAAKEMGYARLSSRSIRLSWPQAVLCDQINAVLSAGGVTGGRGVMKGGYVLIGSTERTASVSGRHLSATKIASSFNHIITSVDRLPPIVTKTATATGHSRCSHCAKKTGLTTSFSCKCGSAFCAAHRYPEEHLCSFDHKTEGRKMLKEQNPVVTAPKLPKI
jgi:AN1-type zinc finger and ubiquitin domain-containing protein 1